MQIIRVCPARRRFECGRTLGRRKDQGAVNMFKVIIFVHALISGWRDVYEVGTEFASLRMCEAARPELADDFKGFLEKRHMEEMEIESKCVNSADQI